MITSDAKRTHDIKHRIVTAKATFNKKLLHQQIGLYLRKKLKKCYIWSTRFYGADTCTLRKKTRNILTVRKCGAGEGWRSVGPIK
jgi:hypothetical protein